MKTSKTKNCWTSKPANETFIGESLEDKLARMLTNKEPIEATEPMAYSGENDGVAPQFNPRTDRWEIAREAMQNVKSMQEAQKAAELAKTESKGAEEPKEPKQEEVDGK